MQTVQPLSIEIAALVLIVSLSMVPTFLKHTAEAKTSERFLIQKTDPLIEDPFLGHELHDIVIIFRGEDKISEMKGGVRSGSVPFVGSGLALHALDGEPFTASYFIDGWKQALKN